MESSISLLKSHRPFCLKLTFIFLTLICFFSGFYINHFKRAPTFLILQSNIPSNYFAKNNCFQYDDYSEDAQVQNAKCSWEKWTKDNNFVSIGNIYNSCRHDKNQIIVGKVVLMEDNDMGDLLSGTFFNISLKKKIFGGRMHIETKFNDKPMSSQNWNLCADGTEVNIEEVMTIPCPVAEGNQAFVKKKKIPLYLPKGKYNAKSWIVDQDGDEVVCSLSEFIL